MTTNNSTVSASWTGSIDIVHAVGSFFPDVIGGTEVFVASLVEALSCDDGGRRLHQSVVMVPANIPVAECDLVNGVRLIRYPCESDSGTTTHFARALESVDAKIYHHHGWQPDLNHRHIRIAKEQGMKTLLTLHTSFPYCSRQDFLYQNKSGCHGPFSVQRCTMCVADSHGAGAISKTGIVSLPISVANALRSLPLRRRYKTALSLKRSVRNRLSGFDDALSHVDKVTVFTGWQSDLMRELGVDASRVALIRHGKASMDSSLHSDQLIPPQVMPDDQTKTSHGIRCAFVGRIAPEKGLATLFEAWQLLDSSINATLDVYGPSISAEPGVPVSSGVTRMTALDQRIRLRGVLNPGAVVPTLRACADLLLVPSRWLETGPLVVLDAFEARIPVFGSDRGGIRELVVDGQNGRLLPPDEPQAWAMAIRELAKRPDSLNTYRRMVRKPRSMSDVARDFGRVYAEMAGWLNTTSVGVGQGAVARHVSS